MVNAAYINAFISRHLKMREAASSARGVKMVIFGVYGVGK
jgi:hypothetical protein